MTNHGEKCARWRRKQPDTVEAWQFSNSDPWLNSTPPSWVNPTWLTTERASNSNGAIRHSVAYLTVPTATGSTRADVGDWIIKNPNGTLQVSKTHDFTAAYEQVS